MAAKLPLDVHEAFYRVVHDYPGGVKELAAKMGLTVKVLYNKADPENDSYNKPTLADGVQATLATGDNRIVQAFANTVGGVYYDLPDLSKISTDALMLHILRIESEGGDFYRSINNSLEKDNQINPGEYAKIEREAHEWIGAILEGLERMREMAGVRDE